MMGGGARAGRVAAFVALLATAALAPSCAPAAAATTGARDAAAGPRVEERTFTSDALGRTMPYLVYLPPGYAAGSRRYPVLYMLHGMGGSDTEWRSYGLLDAADRLTKDGEIGPLIIVMPQGDRSYWMDQASGAREAWGTYTARDLVNEVDLRFRTVLDSGQRAIGGVSMGAHGAVQLALNHPGTFGAVGAHSLVLRSPEQAMPTFGTGADYARRDPMKLVRSAPERARSLALWIDIGDADPWVSRAAAFEREISDLSVAHEWHPWPGGHSATYWRSHVADYLRFYDRAFRWAAGRAAYGGIAFSR